MAVVPLAACGDDDNSATSDTLATADKAAFCKLAQTMTDQEDFPTATQVAKYRELAPSSLDASLDVVEPPIKKYGGSDDPTKLVAAFAADPFEKAILDLDAFETKTCGIDHSDDQAEVKVDNGANRVDVTAKEYEFALPDSVPAGATSLVLSAKGREAHFMDVVQLAEGHTLEEYLAYKGDPSTSGLTTGEERSSGLAAPGGDDQEVINADLTPGTYAMLCFLPGPDGTPHAFMGMAKQFTVS
jgi:hypothetical protein